MDFDPELQQPHWLTDDEVDRIIAAASADDIIEALAVYPNAEQQPMMITREIFNRSAARLGLANGATASQMVPASAFAAFAGKLGDLLKSDNPLSEATDLSPISVDSGESVL